MKGSDRIVGLDLMRFFAASAVMLFHLGFWSWAPDYGTPQSILDGATSYPELVGISWWGWVGVEIFFVLSGFVIAFSAQKGTALVFFRSRFLTLVPTALVCATITLAVAIAIGWESLPSLLARYIRTITFFPLGPWIDGVWWTLGVEIAFYSVVLALLLRRSLASLERVITLIGVFSAAVWMVWFLIVSTQTVPNISGIPPRLLELLLVYYGMYFAAGVVMWAGAFKGWTRTRLVVFTVMIAAGIMPIYAKGASQIAELEIPSTPWVPVSIWLIAVVTMQLLVRMNERISRALPHTAINALGFVGLATYSLYLLHDVVGVAVLTGLLSYGFERFSALLLSMAAMIGLSLCVTYFVKHYLRSKIGSLLGMVLGLFQRKAAIH